MRSLADISYDSNEKRLSLTVLLSRLCVSFIFLYVIGGTLLFYREFLYNAAVIGLSVATAVGLLIGQLLLTLFLIIGWFTRMAAGVSILLFGFIGFLFFGTDLNKIYVVLLLLAITSLLPVLLLGAGRYSLDFYSAHRKGDKKI